MFGTAGFIGFNGALCTFASQAVGARKYQYSGYLLWRARYLWILVFLAVSPIFVFSAQILQTLG